MSLLTALCEISPRGAAREHESRPEQFLGAQACSASRSAGLSPAAHPRRTRRLLALSRKSPADVLAGLLLLSLHHWLVGEGKWLLILLAARTDILCFNLRFNSFSAPKSWNWVGFSGGRRAQSENGTPLATRTVLLAPGGEQAGGELVPEPKGRRRGPGSGGD